MSTHGTGTTKGQPPLIIDRETEIVVVMMLQVAAQMKDNVRILKVDTDEEKELSTQLKVRQLCWICLEQFLVD